MAVLSVLRWVLESQEWSRKFRHKIVLLGQVGDGGSLFRPDGNKSRKNYPLAAACDILRSTQKPPFTKTLCARHLGAGV